MSHQPQSMFDPHAIREMIVRHKTILIRGPLIALALGALVYVFAPRTYRSESRIFLRLGRESVGLDPTATTGQTLALQQADRKDEVKSAIEVFNSESTIGEAVDKIGAPVVLGRDSKGFSLIRIVTAPLHWAASLVKSIDPVSEREEAIIVVQRHLYVSAERDSNVISVQYDAKSPKLAQTVCDAIIDVYQHEHIRIHRSEASRPFFAEQQERLRTELDYALERVRSVKNEMGLSTIDQRRSSLEAQFNAVELDRLSTEEQLATAQARVADLEKRINEVPERLIGSKKSVPNQGADLLRQQLYALQVKVMELKARFKETHPLVIAAEEQLAEAKQVLTKQATQRTETTDNINTIYRDLSLELKRDQSQVAGLKARITELSQQKQTVLVALCAVNDEDVKLDQLNRQTDLARDRFMKYSQSMEEARIDKALETDRISNVSIVQAATLAEKPVSPSKPLIVIATLLLAIAGPIAFVLGSERLNTWLHPVDAAKNGSETHGIAGTNGTRRRRRVASRRLSPHPQSLSHTQPPV